MTPDVVASAQTLFNCDNCKLSFFVDLLYLSHFVTDSKPSLRLLEVTVCFEDYFPSDEPDDPQNATRYKKIITNLRVGDHP